jgi:hypothetical protein
MMAIVPVTSGEGEGEDDMQKGTTRSMAWLNPSFASYRGAEEWPGVFQAGGSIG